jgi:hypothetical protein
VIAERGGCGGDEAGEGVDELARLIEVDLRVGLVGETDLDRGRTEQVHRHRVDHFDRRNICDVADLLIDREFIESVVLVHPRNPLLFLGGLRAV